MPFEVGQLANKGGTAEQFSVLLGTGIFYLFQERGQAPNPSGRNVRFF
ncbi:hypothetical protein P378_15135 [Desulforamulus profundi]|uniref:Uncharacterized protein n=1 Tax=Desulforamulus profundi TaxID=1383067 RepID=A0A2C6LH69_9FIRM|nr:hypothetical protein P378_15135 [Desulforamulus profundi]